jgi:hypothetical protein
MGSVQLSRFENGNIPGFSELWSTEDQQRARQISSARHTPYMTGPNDQ